MYAAVRLLAEGRRGRLRKYKIYGMHKSCNECNNDQPLKC